MTMTTKSPSPLPSANGLGQHGASVGANSPVSGATIETALSAISVDIGSAVEWLRKDAAEKSNPLSKTALAKLVTGRATYLANLKKVALANAQGLKKQFEVAKHLLFYSPQARLYAVLRALHKRGKMVTLAELHARANELSVWKPLEEAVVVRWIPKAGKKIRAIARSSFPGS